MVTRVEDHLQGEHLEQYILSHIDPEPQYLRELRREAHVRLVHPRMISGHLQGRLLTILVSLVRPRHILEIGTYTAYATLCMAEALEDDGLITTIEINDEMGPFIERALSASGYREQVELVMGDALELIPAMDLSRCDLVYIDADKRHYIEYFELIRERLPHGTLILADNTLWSGKVIDEHANDPQTRGIKLFNDYIAKLDGWQKVILPIRDGLTLIRKL